MDIFVTVTVGDLHVRDDGKREWTNATSEIMMVTTTTHDNEGAALESVAQLKERLDHLIGLYEHRN